MIRELLRAILNVIFGARTVDNTKDWYAAHEKARTSRAEIEQVIAESERKSQHNKE